MCLKGGVARGIVWAFAFGVLMAFSIGSVPRADAAEIVDRGASPPPLSRGPVAGQAVSETVVNPASADGYWTPARLAAAQPAPVSTPATSLDVPELGSDASVSAATGDFTPGNVSRFPQVVHGKIFFTAGATDYSCSGTIVYSQSRSLVYTAGHCVYSQTEHDWVTNLVFIPGYENGNMPLGYVSAVWISTTDQWLNNGNFSYDIGVIKVDYPIEELFAARQIAFDLNPVLGNKGREYTLYGYPSEPSPPFDGEILRGCRVRFVDYDSDQGPPRPLAVAPCSMGQGSSGGGWITSGNYLSSVVSYRYCDTVPSLCKYIFGPRFSNAAKTLYLDAGGSPAPTLKLVKGPPKIVRKRNIPVKLGGDFATWPGFYFRLDSQRRVYLSGNVRIKRLRPGKHTLQVQAVDQTGHLSQKKITLRFRVILPR